MSAALQQLHLALEMLKAQKPNDRSERDRCVAVAITDLQRVIAWCSMYCAETVDTEDE